MGVAFKAETDDIRDSLSIKLIDKLKKNKINVIYTDEYYVNERSYKFDSFLKKVDIVIVGVPHKKYLKYKFPRNKEYIDIWGIIKKNYGQK